MTRRGYVADLRLLSGMTIQEVYVRRFRKGWESRTAATVMAIHEAVMTSPEPIPNVEFIVELGDQVC